MPSLADLAAEHRAITNRLLKERRMKAEDMAVALNQRRCIEALIRTGGGRPPEYRDRATYTPPW